MSETDSKENPYQVGTNVSGESRTEESMGEKDVKTAEEIDSSSEDVKTAEEIETPPTPQQKAPPPPPRRDQEEPDCEVGIEIQ